MFFQQDVFSQLQPWQKRSAILYNALVSACAAGGCWEAAFFLLQEMQEVSLRRDRFSFGGVMDACAKAQQWQLALAVFGWVQELRLGNCVMTSSLVSALARARQWQRAAGLTLLASGESNEWSFSAAIQCQRSWATALHLFQAMPQALLQQDLPCRNALFVACRGLGHWRVAQAAAEKGVTCDGGRARRAHGKLGALG